MRVHEDATEEPASSGYMDLSNHLAGVIPRMYVLQEGQH
jgi:hypothetical protein